MSYFEPTDDLHRVPVVSFTATAARMRRFAAVLALTFVTVTTVRSVAAGTVSLQIVAETFGFLLLAALFGEVLIVGSAALKGARTAKQSGERLSRGDVTLTPPQLNRWLSRRLNAPGRPDQS